MDSTCVTIPFAVLCLVWGIGLLVTGIRLCRNPEPMKRPFLFDRPVLMLIRLVQGKARQQVLEEQLMTARRVRFFAKQYIYAGLGLIVVGVLAPFVS